MSFRRLLAIVYLFCAPAFAAPEAYLDLKVTSGSSDGTEVAKPTDCHVALIAPEHLALVKAAQEGKLKVYTPGAIVPNIEYTARWKGRKIFLETHSERGTVVNESPAAQELQDIVFEACRS